METAPIESDQLRAERLLIELCPDNSELRKITKAAELAMEEANSLIMLVEGE